MGLLLPLSSWLLVCRDAACGAGFGPQGARCEGAPPVIMQCSFHLGGGEGVALVLGRRDVHDTVAAPGKQQGKQQVKCGSQGQCTGVRQRPPAAVSLSAGSPRKPESGSQQCKAQAKPRSLRVVSRLCDCSAEAGGTTETTRLQRRLSATHRSLLVVSRL